MKLKSFGCSHVFGNEMLDTEKSGGWVPSKAAWPALLADHLNSEYQCFARAGRGNLSIAEQVLSHAGLEPALFVINWTYIDRFDYNQNNSHHWTTCRPGESDPASTEYYRRLHSEYRDKLTTLMHIKLCIDTLEQHHQPFIMTCMDRLIFDRAWHVSPAVTALQNFVEPRITDFNGMNFVEYAQSLGHSTTALGHLMENGHAAAADYIITWYKQNTIYHLHPF